MAQETPTDKLRVLYFALGTRGDVMPGVSVCRALQSMGHSTLFVSSPNYRESVEAYGLTFASCCTTGWQWRNEFSYLSEEEVEEMLVTQDPKRFLDIFGERGLPWNLCQIQPEACHGLKKIMDAENFDVVYTNVCSSFTGLRVVKKAQESRNVVFISSNFSPGMHVVTGSNVPIGYTKSKYGWINRLKHMHNMFTIFFPAIAALPEMKKSQEEVLKVEGIDKSSEMSLAMVLASETCLGMWSPALFPPQPDYEKTLIVTGAALAPAPPGWKPSAALEAFMQRRDGEGRPPVVVDFGSMPAGMHLQERVATILANLGFNVCLQVGASKEAVRKDFGVLDSIDGELDAKCPNIFRVNFVSHDWLFPKASVLVCHGGAGTLQRCLMAGTPIVICPMVAVIICDQRWHGRFVDTEGLGTMIPTLKPTEDDVKVAVDKALACKEACVAMSKKMLEQEDGAVVTAREIQRVAFEKRDAYAKKSSQKGCFGFK
mmetsp:Transcript_63135/g.150517  ORF Transcript_63135/g.150517 Transcript_63135/m.150517 type:complete len:486 (+) Transcript_63135:76-1533(+)